MTDATTAYWRKILKVDEPVDASFLKNFRSPLEIFRPFMFLFLKLLLFIYCRTKVHGVENIPRDPPFILAPNHISVLDHAVVSLAIGKQRREQLYSLSSKHFYDNTVARIFMKMGANVMRLDREEDFIIGLSAAAKVLKLGKSIYLNPEGTRSKTGELLPFKVGVGVLAVETGVPIIPVFIKGTFEVIRPGSVFPRPHEIEVTFGKPITMEKYIKMKETGMAYDAYKAATDELFERVRSLKVG
jgi:1-acyl-sn-glycerol-3-phosphate acyltransferase